MRDAGGAPWAVGGWSLVLAAVRGADGERPLCGGVWSLVLAAGRGADGERPLCGDGANASGPPMRRRR